MFPISSQLQIERGRGVERVQAITFHRLSYRLQLHGVCWLLPCRAFQKGSALHISSEQQGNAEGSTALCQPLRETEVAPIYVIFTGDDAMSFQLKVKYLYSPIFLTDLVP